MVDYEWVILTLCEDNKVDGNVFTQLFFISTLHKDWLK